MNVLKRVLNDKGLTLVEILIASAINLSIMAAVVGVFIAQKQHYATENEVIDMHEVARLTFTKAVREIRMTGYVSGGNGGYAANAITEADTDKITFLWDLDDNGTRETITLRMAVSGDALYKAETPKILRVEQNGANTAITQLATGVASFSLAYYDGSSGGALNAPLTDANINSASGTQTNRDAIRVIKFSVVFQTEHKSKVSKTFSRKFPLTSIISPRNLRI